LSRASPVITTFWIIRVLGHTIKGVFHKFKHMLIEAGLGGIFPIGTSSKLHMTSVVCLQSGKDFNGLTLRIACNLGPWHLQAFGIPPIIVVSATFRKTAYTGVSVQTMMAIFLCRYTFRSTPVQAINVCISISRWWLKDHAMTISKEWERQESKDLNL